MTADQIAGIRRRVKDLRARAKQVFLAAEDLPFEKMDEFQKQIALSSELSREADELEAKLQQALDAAIAKEYPDG